MAFWWILILVALAFVIYRFLLTLVSFFGMNGSPSAADVKGSDVSDAENQTMENPIHHKQRNNASKRAGVDLSLQIPGVSGFPKWDNNDEKPSKFNSPCPKRGQIKKRIFDSLLQEIGDLGSFSYCSTQASLKGSKNQIEKSPTQPRVSERDKGKAVSNEEKGEIAEVVSMSLSSELSGPERQEQEGNDNSRYGNTGKRLPINFEKQRNQIPTAEVNIDVRANIIFLDRDYSEESDPPIPSQEETNIIPTVSPSTSSNQEEESRAVGQNNTEVGNPKKRRWYKLFSWWQKK